MDTVEFLKIIRQFSFDAFLEYVAYRRLRAVDWKDVLCVGWFSYEGESNDLLSFERCKTAITNRSSMHKCRVMYDNDPKHSRLCFCQQTIKLGLQQCVNN